MTIAPRWGGVSHCGTYENPEKKAIHKDTCHDTSCMSVQNFAGTRPAKWHKTDTSGSLNVPLETKENAASGAVERGVFENETTEQSHEQITPKRGRSAMSKWASTEHKKVARAIGYALTLGTESAWHGLTIVLMARLSDQERAALAFAVLMSLSDEHASAVAEVAA